MDAAPVPPEPDRDREFSRPGATVASDSDGPLDDYQRLVANPFLGLVGLLGGVYAARWLLGHARGPALVAGLLVLCLLGLGLRYLFHYHCLDCGGTGPLLRYRRHACAGVRERQRTGRRRWLRAPNPIVQVVIWVYLLLLGAMVFGALGRWR